MHFSVIYSPWCPLSCCLLSGDVCWFSFSLFLKVFIRGFSGAAAWLPTRCWGQSLHYSGCTQFIWCSFCNVVIDSYSWFHQTWWASSFRGGLKDLASLLGWCCCVPMGQFLTCSNVHKIDFIFLPKPVLSFKVTDCTAKNYCNNIVTFITQLRCSCT